MSYAEAAARGPSQSPEEEEGPDNGRSRAPAPPQIVQEDRETHRTVDVDSPHVISVSSNYSGETDTQFERIRREAEQAEYAAKVRMDKAKEKAGRESHKAKEHAKQAGHSLQENRENPVVVGNFVVWTAIAAALGFGAYKQNQAGTLNWKVAGTWAGAVGLFATGDYFVSKWLFQNKYPRK